MLMVCRVCVETCGDTTRNDKTYGASFANKPEIFIQDDTAHGSHLGLLGAIGELGRVEVRLQETALVRLAAECDAVARRLWARVTGPGGLLDVVQLAFALEAVVRERVALGELGHATRNHALFDVYCPGRPIVHDLVADLVVSLVVRTIVSVPGIPRLVVERPTLIAGEMAGTLGFERGADLPHDALIWLADSPVA